MIDLQKQIEELEKAWKEADSRMSEQWETKDALGKALSIIKGLRLKISYLEDEARCKEDIHQNTRNEWQKQHQLEMEEMRQENKVYIECLRRINSCDDSAAQQSRDAHKVLKQFGKL